MHDKPLPKENAMHVRNENGPDEMVEVRVSGFVYYECFDPGCTEFPRERPEIGEPVRVKFGRGRQFRYTVPADVAEVMLEHAEVFGEAISFGVDDPTAGRKVLAWVRRERERLGLR